MASKAIVERSQSAIPVEPAVAVEKDQEILAAAARLGGEDLCSIADLSSSEVRAILKLGHDVKRNPVEYRRALDSKQMVLMFEKASLRTRLSFEAGINTLGGNAIFFDQTNSPLGERESIADVARNVERWVDVIVLRTYAHDTITEMAANSRVPVVNALSDFEHPCQALADFMTLEEHFGASAGLNFTYVGDGNNVCHSLMLTGAQLGANVTVATPRGYSPDIEIVTLARDIAQRFVTSWRAVATGQDHQAAFSWKNGIAVRAVVPAPEQGLEDFFLELTSDDDAKPAVESRRRGIARVLGRRR